MNQPSASVPPPFDAQRPDPAAASIPAGGPALPDDRTLPLDERIRRAEQRLLAREHDLRERIEGVVLRVRHAVRPRRWLAPALGGMAVLAAVWLLLRRRAGPRAALQRGAAAVRSMAARAMQPRGAAPADLPWAGVLALAWPLLPAALRARMSPAAVVTLAGVVMPWAQRRFGARHRPLGRVASFDLARAIGTWHEVAHLPPMPGEQTARFEVIAQRDGALQVLQHRRDRAGRERVRRGVALAVPGSGNAQLRVSMQPAWLRELPWAWTDLHVLAFDEPTGTALLGHADRRHLRVLSRTPQLPQPQLERLMEQAARHGFAVQRLQVLQPQSELPHASAAP